MALKSVHSFPRFIPVKTDTRHKTDTHGWIQILGWPELALANKNSIVYLIDVDGEDELDPLYIAGITFASLLVFLLLVVFILSIFMVYRKKSKYYDL